MEYQLTQPVQEQAVTTLQKWLKIPSVLSNDASQYPFGKKIQEALECAIETCHQLGFKTYIDPQGYYGYAEVGQGEELLAILCHLDVVPVGNEKDWIVPPFSGEIVEEKLYGRGTQDDKGPTVMVIYAIKALMDASYKFNKRVRVIFGTDEETLWRCMARYNQQEESATFGFAPDSNFPLTFAEKGLLQVYLTGKGSQEVELDQVGALNVVPEQATYQGKYATQVANQLDNLKISYEFQDSCVTAFGKSVHSKDANKGKNALVALCRALAKEVTHPVLDFIQQTYSKEGVAPTIFGDVCDEMSGELTFNIASVEIQPTYSKIGIDLRLPVTADYDRIVEQIKSFAHTYQLEYEEFDYLKALYVPTDTPLVQTLLEVYRSLTGDMTPPIASGGATFARTMENCVAFGANLPNMPVLAHQVNEYVTLEAFYQGMEIYAHAIKNLACH